MDLVLKLRELRRMKGLSQKEAAKKSGIGVKSISSWETGERVDSLKISQLRKLLNAYGISEDEFFNGSVDVEMVATIPGEPQAEVMNTLRRVSKFPPHIQLALAQRFNDMVVAAECARQ